MKGIAKGNDRSHDRSFLNGGGELGERIRAYDWTRTPLGPPERWPVGLKTAVRIRLTSRQAMWIGWGPELTYLYNDPYKAIIGGKHPIALGQPTSVVWREIWDEISPMLMTALGGDQGTYVEAQLLIMERNGYPEETYYTFSYSPVPDDEGGARGIICANTDDTERVVRAQRLKRARWQRHASWPAARWKPIRRTCRLRSSTCSTPRAICHAPRWRVSTPITLTRRRLPALTPACRGRLRTHCVRAAWAATGSRPPDRASGSADYAGTNLTANPGKEQS